MPESYKGVGRGHTHTRDLHVSVFVKLSTMYSKYTMIVDRSA